METLWPTLHLSSIVVHRRAPALESSRAFFKSQFSFGCFFFGCFAPLFAFDFVTDSMVCSASYCEPREQRLWGIAERCSMPQRKTPNGVPINRLWCCAKLKLFFLEKPATKRHRNGCKVLQGNFSRSRKLCNRNLCETKVTNWGTIGM